MKDEKKVESLDNSNEPEQVNVALNAENGDTAGEKNLIKGKFKSYEDLEVAYDNAQKKLTQTSQKLAQIEKKSTNSELKEKVAQQEPDFKANAEYMEFQKNLLLKYLPYSHNQNAASLNDFVAGLPPQLASQFGADLRELRSGFELKEKEAAKQREELQNKAITQALQEFEQHNTGELEKPFKKIAFDFYKSFGQFSPQDASAVLELTDKVISAYEAQRTLQQQFSDENNLAKSKLTSSSTLPSSPLTEGQHVFSRAEIQEMMKTPAGREKFLKVEKIIFNQMAKGLIK